ILGANLQQLLMMLSREFVMMVLLAMCIAIPLTWWGMNVWLQQYAYRTQISIWSFLAAAAGVLVLTILTVWVNVGRAALTRPVKSIRTE
ncbi:MAG: ABC transporter permease, partial [Chitinophagaceae bacterium]|nr:ABC transporter permease [Chitinophagaceae bacterium]